MAREIYKPADNQWVSYEPVTDAHIDAIYDDVGERFPISWVDGEPVIDFDDLPDGVDESDVKQAVRDHHPRR